MIFPVPILPGMRQDIDARAGGVPPGMLRLAQNVRFSEAGTVQRRRGTRGILGHWGSVQPLRAGEMPEFAARLGDAHVIGIGGVVGGWPSQDGSGATVFRTVGVYGSAMPVGSRQVLYPGAVANAYVAPTVAVASNGSTLYGQVTSEGLHLVYRDPQGNLIGERVMAGYTKAVAFARDGGITLIAEHSSGALHRSVSLGQIGAPLATGISLESPGDAWDAAPWGTRVFLALHNSDSNELEFRCVGIDDIETLAVAESANPRIAVYAAGEYAWVGFSDEDEGKARLAVLRWSSADDEWADQQVYDVWSYTSTQESTPPIPGPGNSGLAVRVVGAIKEDGLWTWKAATVTATGTVAAHPDQHHARPCSKPFGPRGEWVWAELVTTAAGEQNPVRRVLLRTRHVGAAADAPFFVELATEPVTWDEATSYVDNWPLIPRTPMDSYVAPVLRRLDTGAALVDFHEFVEFSLGGLRSPAYAAGALVVPGQPCDVMQPALPASGASTQTGGAELGFAAPPTIVALDSEDDSGSLEPNTEYTFVAIYKWVDALGRLHESAPSAPATITTGGDHNTVTVTVTGHDFSRKALGGAVTIELYRYQAGGQVFHVCADEVPATGATQDITVTASDADIAAHRILYTDGGVVADGLAPSARFVVASEERVFCGGLFDPTLVEASKIILPGEPPRFTGHDAFRVRFPEPLTGMAFLDGTLYAFSRQNIYALPTDGGPSDQGAGQFASPRLIAAGTGCVNDRSAVATPIGVFYQSERGVELLPRGGATPVFIGSGIRDELVARPEITSAAVHQDHQARTVRFVCRDPNADAQLELDSSASGTGTVGGGDAVTFSHTLGGGENRLLLVGVGVSSAGAGGLTVTYGGVEMALLESVGPSELSVGVFVLREHELPPAGEHNVSVTGGVALAEVQAIAVSFANARQHQNLTLYARAEATSTSDVPQLSIGTRFSNSEVVSFLAAHVTGEGTVLFPAAEQVGIEEVQGQNSFAASRRAAPESGPYTVMWTIPESERWAQIAVEVAPVRDVARVLVYDIDRNAWSVDVYPDDTVLTAAGTHGRALLVQSPFIGELILPFEVEYVTAARIEDDAVLGDEDGLGNSTRFESRLEFHALYPFAVQGMGLFGAGVVRSVIAAVAAQDTGTKLHISLARDGEFAREVEFPLATAGRLEYRYATPLDTARCTSIELSAWDSSDGVAGLTWYGFALDADTEGLPRRRRGGESA